MIAQSPYIVDSTLLVAIIWDRQLKSGHFVGVQPSEPTTAGYIWRLYASSIMNKELWRWSAPIVKQLSVPIFNLSFKIEDAIHIVFNILQVCESRNLRFEIGIQTNKKDEKTLAPSLTSYLRETYRCFHLNRFNLPHQLPWWKEKQAEENLSRVSCPAENNFIWALNWFSIPSAIDSPVSTLAVRPAQTFAVHTPGFQTGHGVYRITIKWSRLKAFTMQWTLLCC